MPREYITGIIRLLFILKELINSLAVALFINNIVAIIISTFTEVGFSIFRDVVVRDVKERARVVKVGLGKVDAYKRCGEELLV